MTSTPTLRLFRSLPPNKQTLREKGRRGQPRRPLHVCRSILGQIGDMPQDRLGVLFMR